jgi:protein-disulfide isomerase
MSTSETEREQVAPDLRDLYENASCGYHSIARESDQAREIVDVELVHELAASGDVGEPGTPTPDRKPPPMIAAAAVPDPVLTPDEATDHIIGPASARVSIVEYGDFECPSCAQAHAAMRIILNRFGDRVRFVFREFPQIGVHPHAEFAAEAAEAAGAQGCFWPFYDTLFENQEHLEGKHLRNYARQLGLDMERYDYEMKDHVYLQRVQEHVAGGTHLRIRATPAFYVNGTFTDVSFGLQHLEESIERALAVAK